MRCALAASVLLGAASAQWEPEDLPVYMPTEQHELEAYEPKADAKSTVVAGSARFTVLSERLIRMEYSESGSFEDKATMGFLNRQSDAAFKSKKSGGSKRKFSDKSTKRELARGGSQETAARDALL